MLISVVLQHINNHGFATREEIDKLLIGQLPNHMDEKQRKKRIENILQDMKKLSIKNIGTRIFPKWVKISE